MVYYKDDPESHLLKLNDCQDKCYHVLPILKVKLCSVYSK